VHYFLQSVYNLSKIDSLSLRLSSQNVESMSLEITLEGREEEEDADPRIHEISIYGCSTATGAPTIVTLPWSVPQRTMPHRTLAQRLSVNIKPAHPSKGCWDIWILVSLATPQQIDTNTNRTVRASRPVHTPPFAMSFIWLSGSSVRAGALSQQVMSLADLSLLHSVSICVYSVSSESSESSGVFQCSLRLSAFRVGNNYSCPFELLSVGNHLCFLRWSALSLSLHCISHLWACWASAPCSAPIWAWCVEIISTFWAHHSFAGERITKLYTSHFHFITIALPLATLV